MIEMPDRSWTPEPSARATIRNLFRDLFRHKPGPHNGAGHVALLRAHERTAGSPLIDLIHFVVLPAGATIGHRRHHDDREPV
jgi:hypothetical protein